MALSDAYATAAEYRAVIDKTDTGSDDDILTALTVVTRQLENELHRFFNKDASDATRVYVPESRSRDLWIDDLSAAPTSVTIDTDGDGDFDDEDALAATDYEPWPLNATLEPEPQPYTRLHLPPWSTVGLWTPDLRVQVIGKSGWPSVPPAIKRATIELTALLRLETPRATQRISEMEGTIQASPQAQGIIKRLYAPYRSGRGFFS